MDTEQGEQAQAFAQAFEDPTERPEPEQAQPEQQPEAPPPEYVQITRDVYERISQAAEKLPVLEQQFAKRIDQAFGKIGVIEQRGTQTGGVLTDDDIAPFKDDFPELHAALQKVRAPANFDALLEERTKPYVERLDTATQELREMQQFQVATLHPDWQEFTAGEQFKAWAATKDDAYRQKLANTWAPAVIAGAITEAKKFAAEQTAAAEKQQRSQERKQTNTRAEVLGTAIQPRGTGGRYVSTGTTEQDGYLSAWGS
jgi:hypothetical protein